MVKRLFIVLAACIGGGCGYASNFALHDTEFAKYYEQITGRMPPKNLISFAIDPAVSKSGKDAYTIVSKGSGVDITGSNLRSVWYGLYDLLERRGGCHWFWDGDVVPKKETIDLSGLDVREEAHFEWRGLRYFAHRGLTRFQAEHWGPDDWKREIDWCLKRRLNVFMLRIGQDDLFQRAYPDIVPYPDASKDLPGHGKGYDNRTLFWSLEYRGRLRQMLQRYAFDRGLEVPEDFGTMTHWYSRTPEEFLEKVNPPFLPQATSGYKERNGLVWDIRDDKWVDAYWKLTQTAVRDYGKPGSGLLHTIGLGERLCFTNRADNLNLKIDALHKFLNKAHADYPDKKVLLAGWDFYFTWFPEEVQALVKTLDPKRDIIWDYEGDATRDYRPEMKGQRNDFTKWGVVGKFPYTYSIFLAFEDALDMRANYPLIEARQKIVQDDPKCAGYVFWPESSHTDTLLLRYFTANAWSSRPVPIADVTKEFCASRYGKDAAYWERIWNTAIPVSSLLDWGGNYCKYAVNRGRFHPAHDDPPDEGAYWAKRVRMFSPAVDAYAAILKPLLETEFKGEFEKRDAIDLARMAVDRRIIAENALMMDSFHRWKAGKASDAEVVGHAERYARLGELMAELLALHTDFSLWESFCRLDAIEKVTNPNFPNVLMENAMCNYCASHHYEFAEYWYKPVMRQTADKIIAIVKSGDRQAGAPKDSVFKIGENLLLSRSLESMKPKSARTPDAFKSVVKKLLSAADPLAVPVRHKPIATMGRDCWRVLRKYSFYGSSSKSMIGYDNEELNNSPALSDIAFGYVASKAPPPADTGLAVWPRLEHYFRNGEPDAEILTSNTHPDRPFFIDKRSERNRGTWGSPVELDLAGYSVWRTAHPNLVVDGNCDEWCNDLNSARKALNGVSSPYVDDQPKSQSRADALRSFLGELPKTRYEQLDLMKRYYEMRRERNFGGKMSILDAHLNSLHVAADFGASLIRMETTASGQYRHQLSAMFTRGAARQFGVPWEWYIAGYMNGYATNGQFMGDCMCRYPHTAEEFSSYPKYGKELEAKWMPGGKWRVGCGGLEFGISRSLFRRDHYLAYLSGANFIQLEEWKSVLKMWNREEGKTVFSPRGRIYAEFVDFTRNHPDRGAHFSPVAVCVPLAQGYPTWGGSPWGESRFGYTNGDKAVDAVFYTLVPGYDYNARLAKGDEMCLRNSPYANMYDVIAPDAKSQSPDTLLAVMKSYKAIVVVGDYVDREWEKTLAKYESEGGKVVRVDGEMLKDEVKSGKGRGVAVGEARYPKLEATLAALQEAYFPFKVEGRCMYGLTVADDHVWLYVLNNDGVTKFVDAPQTLDESKASEIHVTPQTSAPHFDAVTELISGKTVKTDNGSFSWRVAPGDLALFEIKQYIRRQRQ